MEIKQDRVINEETVLFTGEYDAYGHLLTCVLEGDSKFLVAMPPVKFIDRTLLSLGSSFRGSLDSSKEILGTIKMYPIKINDRLNIWLFPTKSYKHPGCVWFSLFHVKGTHAVGAGKTLVELSYGHSIEIKMKESAFIKKLQKAEQLRDAIIQNTKSPLTVSVEPKGFYIYEKAGKYMYLPQSDE
jgi:competence protein ComK